MFGEAVTGVRSLPQGAVRDTRLRTAESRGRSPMTRNISEYHQGLEAAMANCKQAWRRRSPMLKREAGKEAEIRGA